MTRLGAVSRMAETKSRSARSSAWALTRSVMSRAMPWKPSMRPAGDDRPHVLADPDLLAVLLADRELEVGRLARLRRLLVEAHRARHPVGPHQLEVLHRQQLALVEAEDARGHRIDEREPAERIGAVDHVARVVDEVAIPALGSLDGLGAGLHLAMQRAVPRRAADEQQQHECRRRTRGSSRSARATCAGPDCSDAARPADRIRRCSSGDRARRAAARRCSRGRAARRGGTAAKSAALRSRFPPALPSGTASSGGCRRRRRPRRARRRGFRPRASATTVSAGRRDSGSAASSW